MLKNCSCDTVVALGNSTVSGSTIFAKNSDRDDSEIQLVCYYPGRLYSQGEKLKCTYISIPQTTKTYSVLISQPYWMWGCEMGTNEKGVAIGNEAVWTVEKVNSSGLLGMDLVRLGLERGGTAKEARDIIIDLLEKYTQGGNCAKGFSFSYHNSFIICDPTEGFVLETAGKFWVWERVKDVRALSNNLSITKTGDCIRPGTVEYAVKKKLCKSAEDFHFCVCFSESWTGVSERELATGNFLKKNKGKLTPHKMTELLRNHRDGICMHGGFVSAGAQISRLGKISMENYFTATNLPCKSIFHPFAFANEKQQRGITVYGEDKNCLWKKHDEKIDKCSAKDLEQMREFEEKMMSRAGSLFEKKDEEGILKLHNESVGFLRSVYKI